MNLLIPLMSFLFFISIAMFFSLSKKKMLKTTFFFNLLACISILVITSFATEYVIDDLIRISDLKIKYIIILGCFSLFQIILNGYQKKELIAASILSNIIFVVLVILVGARDFIVFYIVIALLSVLTTMLPVVADKNKNLAKHWTLELYQNMMLLLAIIFYYAGTGSLWIEAKVTNENLFLFSYALILIVLCFKLGVFPFHKQVTSQKYEGGGVIFSKALLVQLGIGLVLILLLCELYQKLSLATQNHLAVIISSISLVSIFYGHFLALTRNKVREIISGTLIAQGAYLLVTIAYINSDIKERLIVFYLIHYLVSVASIFVYINKPQFTENKLRGLFYRDKCSAIFLSILALNLGAFPLTSGFAVKYVLSLELLKSGHVLIVGLFLLSFVINIYYIIKMILSLYLQSDNEGGVEQFINPNKLEKLIMGLMTIGIIGGGLFPRIFI